MRNPLHDDRARERARSWWRRERRWQIPISVAMLLVIWVAIAWIGGSTYRGPISAQPEQAGQIEEGSPAQLPEQTRPTATVQGGMDLVDTGKPGSLQKGVDASQVTRDLEIGTRKDITAFDKDFFQVKRGDVIRLRFHNDSDPAFHYRHSWVLVKPGDAGKATMQGYRAGIQQDFIPTSEDVLAHTQMVDPGEADTIIFRAPSQPGDYPFICSFPGHGNAMRGILRVTD